MEFLGKDTKVTIQQKSAGDANGYTWDKIVTLDGLEGYMANVYLRYEESSNGGGNNAISADSNNSEVCDVDGNGKVNSGDLYKIITYLKESDEYSEGYDCNKDGKVNSGDLYYIISYLRQN